MKKTMALVLNLSSPSPTSFQSSSSNRPLPTLSRQDEWTCLLHKLKCHGRFSCLFSDNRREVLQFLISIILIFSAFHIFVRNLCYAEFNEWFARVLVLLGNEKLMLQIEQLA